MISPRIQKKFTQYTLDNKKKKKLKTVLGKILIAWSFSHNRAKTQFFSCSAYRIKDLIIRNLIYSNILILNSIQAKISLYQTVIRLLTPVYEIFFFFFYKSRKFFKKFTQKHTLIMTWQLPIGLTASMNKVTFRTSQGRSYCLRVNYGLA